MKGFEFKRSCKGLFEKVWLYYTHYHLLVIVNVVLVTMLIVNPVLKTNDEYKYGKLPCDPVFTSLILNGKKYEDLQKFRIKLTPTGFTFEYLMIGFYYFSVFLFFIAHLLRNKAFCVLHHVAVVATCLFGLCFAFVSKMISVWAEGMVTGLSGLRTIQVECYNPYQALDMHKYTRTGLAMAAVVALWDVLITRRYEKKYLNVPCTSNFQKYCEFVQKCFPNVFKGASSVQPKAAEDPAEMI